MEADKAAEAATPPNFQIVLNKNIKTIHFLIAMFGYINHAKGHISHIEMTGKNQFKIVEKNPEDVVELEMDYSLVDEKIHHWLNNTQNPAPLILTLAETQTFLQLLHAAYWFATEHKTADIPPDFLTYYDEIMEMANA